MEHKFYKRIPNLLRKYRKVNGYTQIEVAKILGIKNSSKISKWEKGECFPNLINALKIAILYRVMVDSIFIDHLRHLREEMLKKEQEYLRKLEMSSSK